jgi:hypothetical protein
LAEKRWHVFYVSLYQATCESDRCLEYADEKNGIPLLNDADHLSEGGSRLLVRRLFRLGELDCLNDKLPAKSEASLQCRQNPVPAVMLHIGFEEARYCAMPEGHVGVDCQRAAPD